MAVPVGERPLLDLDGAQLLYAAVPVRARGRVGHVEALPLVPPGAAGGEAVLRGGDGGGARPGLVRQRHLHAARLVRLLVHKLVILEGWGGVFSADRQTKRTGKHLRETNEVGSGEVGETLGMSERSRRRGQYVPLSSFVLQSDFMTVSLLHKKIFDGLQTGTLQPQAELTIYIRVLKAGCVSQLTLIQFCILSSAASPWKGLKHPPVNKQG